MRLAQRHLGQRRIAWLFLAPNLVIFGLFTFLPIILNFHYATTGGVQVLPGDRPFVGAANFETLLACRDWLDPSTCEKDLFWKAVFNTASFVLLQVGCMVLFALVTALVLNREIRAPRLLPKRVLLPGIAVAGGGRLDLEVDPAARGPAQRLGRGARRRADALAARCGLGVLLGDLRQHLGAHGLLHADPARGAAGDPQGRLRGRRDGRRRADPRVLADHAAAADAEPAWSSSCWR